MEEEVNVNSKGRKEGTKRIKVSKEERRTEGSEDKRMNKVREGGRRGDIKGERRKSRIEAREDEEEGKW